MVTRAEIVAAARSWRGTPYHHQAYRKGVGCDCIGLIRGLALDPGGFDASDGNPALRPFLAYGRQPDPAKMRAALELFFRPIAQADMAPGDVVWIKIEDEPRHLGVLAPDGYLIHALSTVGRVAEHRMDERWRKRVVAAWRFPNLAEG